MRVAVIGCGSIGSRHARQLAAFGQDVVLCDVDHRRTVPLAEELGIRCWGTTIAGVAEVDAALVCTPADTHAAAARELLAGGFGGPLFVEKPIATNLDDGDVFRSWPHRTTMVGYNLRFQRQARAIKALLAPADSGRLVLRCDARTWPGREYAGVLEECSHEIDLALWLGAPRCVTDAFVQSHTVGIVLGGRWSVVLADQEDGYQRKWTVQSGPHTADTLFTAPEQLGVEMYRDELAHFLACAQAGTPTLCPFADGLAVLDVCAAAAARANEAA